MTGVSEANVDALETTQNMMTEIEKEVQSDVSDKSFTVTSSAYAIGTLIGPILGGFLYDISSFSATTLSFAALGLLLCIVLLFMAIGSRKAIKKVENIKYQAIDTEISVSALGRQTLRLSTRASAVRQSAN